MNSAFSPPPTSGRALVLGGGGSAGNAWLIGVVAGLADAGIDLAEADLIVGTSAGSTAAAQIAGSPPAALFAAAVSAPPPTTAPRGHRRPGPAGPGTRHLDRMREIIAASAGPAEWRRRMGVALGAEATAPTSAQWRATVSARFATALWPRQRVLITAVDAGTGEPVVFDRDSGVDLVDAVAASCAGGFAYEIGDTRYIDGGFRSNADNADLAAGYERVLVLSPLGGRSFTPVEWGTHLATQIAALRAGGSRVETVFPDAESRAAFGDNLMNPQVRPPSARAGYAQGAGAAGLLEEFWTLS